MARVVTWPRIALIAVPCMVLVVARDLTYGWIDTSLSGVLSCLLILAMIMNQWQWETGYEQGHLMGYRRGRLSVLLSLDEAIGSGMSAAQWVEEQFARSRTSARHSVR